MENALTRAWNFKRNDYLGYSNFEEKKKGSFEVGGLIL
jgi:hypothetical protein